MAVRGLIFEFGVTIKDNSLPTGLLLFIILFLNRDWYIKYLTFYQSIRCVARNCASRTATDLVRYRGDVRTTVSPHSQPW